MKNSNKSPNTTRKRRHKVWGCFVLHARTNNSILKIYIGICAIVLNGRKNVFVNIAWTVIYSYFQWVNLQHANKFLSPKIQDCWIYWAVAYYLQHARNAKKPHAKICNAYICCCLKENLKGLRRKWSEQCCEISMLSWDCNLPSNHALNL